jgi:hypothetical protein
VDIPSGANTLHIDSDPPWPMIAWHRPITTNCLGAIVCNFSNPAGGRWFFVYLGDGQPHDINVTLTPAMAATIISLSTPQIAAGAGPVRFSVFGAGFTASSVVRWNGQPLPTELVSPTEVRATVDRDLTSGPPRTVVIDVVDGDNTLGPGALPSNTLAIQVRRAATDVNCDDATTTADALAVLRVLAGLDPAGSCSKDANLDAGVDVVDALLVRNVVAGLAQPNPASFAPAPAAPGASAEDTFVILDPATGAIVSNPGRFAPR